jgi:hypothetical protein
MPRSLALWCFVCLGSSGLAVVVVAIEHVWQVSCNCEGEDELGRHDGDLGDKALEESTRAFLCEKLADDAGATFLLVEILKNKKKQMGHKNRKKRRNEDKCKQTLFWMRVLMTSKGFDTTKLATAPQVEATKVWKKVALE